MRSHNRGSISICSFFFLVFGISLFAPVSPVRIIAGENSVGSWMSGVLLVISSTACAIISMRRGWYPWTLLSTFFILLAIDENFLIHESLKRKIVFVTYEQTNQAIYWLGELPVIGMAVVGMIVAWILWKHLQLSIRWLIPLGAFFGICSVTIDVLGLGVLLEDSLKLFAELAVACALVTELELDITKGIESQIKK